jgi:flagellar hook-basal body complex protein FliE
MIVNTQDIPLSGLSNISFRPEILTQGNTENVFDSVFNAAMDIVNETNRCQLEAEALQLDLAAGRTDNVLSVLLAQERAFSSLNFTVQVTNKIIESYREIMRMQL